MKILVDARELAGRPTGVGRYLLELLRRWTDPSVTRTHDIVLCAHRLPASARELGFAAIETGHVSSGTAWEQWTFAGLASRERPDVLFCPAYTAPLLARTPIALTIHDVSFVAHPEWFTFREGARRRLLTRAAARKAAAVLTVSAFSAAEIAEAFGIADERIHVIRHGVPARVPPSAGVAREPLVLFVGSIFNRRHVPALLTAMRNVRAHVRDARLAIVGENRTQPRQDLAALADRLGVSSIVEFTDYATDERIAELYARALVFAFVSEYEGFGLTPLEALAAGVPPVVADTAVAHETCSHAAVYVKPGDVDALAIAIRGLLTDGRARARILGAAPAALARYSWERAAEETMGVLERSARA